jgi:hypothetical protein
VSPELAIAALGAAFTALSALVSYVAARAGTTAAIKVHLEYLQRDVAFVTTSARAAHWRLDEIDAPQAPVVSR